MIKTSGKWWIALWTGDNKQNNSEKLSNEKVRESNLPPETI